MGEKIIMTKKQLHDKKNIMKNVQIIYEKLFEKKTIVQNPLTRL